MVPRQPVTGPSGVATHCTMASGSMYAFSSCQMVMFKVINDAGNDVQENAWLSETPTG